MNTTPRASRGLALLFLATLALAPGCSIFRAQIGLGFGLGADVQVLGFQHSGLSLSSYHQWGPNYGRDTYCQSSSYCLVLLHGTDMKFDPPETGGPARKTIEHDCIGLFPGPLGLLGDAPMEGWAFEVGLALTFFELRFGVNPLAPLFLEEEPAPAPAPPPQQQRPQQQGEGPVASGQQQQSTGSATETSGAQRQQPSSDAYGSRGAASDPAQAGPQGSFCETCGARVELCGCRR
jgi:hypothetical protein